MERGAHAWKLAVNMRGSAPEFTCKSSDHAVNTPRACGNATRIDEIETNRNDGRVIVTTVVAAADVLLGDSEAALSFPRRRASTDPHEHLHSQRHRHHSNGSCELMPHDKQEKERLQRTQREREREGESTRARVGVCDGESEQKMAEEDER